MIMSTHESSDTFFPSKMRLSFSVLQLLYLFLLAGNL